MKFDLINPMLHVSKLTAVRKTCLVVQKCIQHAQRNIWYSHNVGY